MKDGISICEDLIDRIIPPDIDDAISALSESGKWCGRSVCGGTQQPRLTYKSDAQRADFLNAAMALDRASPLSIWLHATNPRLTVRRRTLGGSVSASINFLQHAVP